MLYVLVIFIDYFILCSLLLLFDVMDSIVMLLCKFRVQILPVRLCNGTSLKDVLRAIYNRWKNLSVGRFSVSYELDDGYCVLENEEDYENMLFLWSNCDRINARVEEDKSSSVGLVDRISDEMDIGEVEVVNRKDPLEKFCRHPEPRYLTDGWADLIEEVGQEFPGGVKEFREVLQKFSIENGFEYSFVKNDKYRVTANCVVVGCEWHVHAILNRTNGAFCIKDLQNDLIVAQLIVPINIRA